MNPTKAKWRKGKRIITGSYRYNRHSDTFTIWLDKPSYDKTTGQSNSPFTTSDDHAGFNGWTVIK